MLIERHPSLTTSGGPRGGDEPHTNMASTSTIKTNCYNFLNSNLRNIIDNKCERNDSASFDEFAEARGRSTRAASLALPNNSLLDLFDKEQGHQHPVNLKPTLTTSIKNTISSTVNSLSKLRRHSTSASVEQDDDCADPQQNGVYFTPGVDGEGVLPLSNENLKRHQKMSTRRSRSHKSPMSSTSSTSYLPPVPKRNMQRSSATPQSRQKSYSVDQRDGSPATNGHMSGKFSSLNSISGREDDIDDDRLSVESSVFEDTPPYSRQQLSSDYFDENSSAILTKKMLSSSNRSSSDSNKSQITIDTGYMSSTTSTASAITNNTESTAERLGGGGGGGTATTNGTFRSRFSSEDTQSSLDSFISSSEPQQRFHGAEYGASYGQTNPSPSYLQTGGTSSYYLATAGTNDVIEYLQKYSARNYPNNLRSSTSTASSATNSKSPANTGLVRQQSQPQQQQQRNQQQVQQQILSGSSSSTSSVLAGATETAINSLSVRGGVPVAAAAGATTTTTTSAATKDESVSAKCTNSLTSISSAPANNNNNSPGVVVGGKQPVGLAQFPPPATSSSSASISSSPSSLSGATRSSISLSSTGVSSITATTIVAATTTTQPRSGNSSAAADGLSQKAPSSRGSLASLAMPLRSQVSFDSAKILQTGQILGAKISQHFTSHRQSQQTSEAPGKNQPGGAGGGGVTQPPPVNPPRRGLNGILNKPPPLTQIHHTKMNQRQDSNISSDSFSITSSPGYNSKGMEAPLLQHSSKIHKSVGAMKHQDSSDSFNMTVRGGPSTATGSRKFNMRQDSTISSDSFSQTSSPGYNSKFMEAPLLAHAAKMHKSE